MMRAVLILLGIIHFISGPVIFFAPQFFYDSIPGLADMGPFNLHFIRDIGLAFAASGGAVVWGALKYNRSVAMAGAVWPILHGLFHIQIWGHRGFPFDHIAIFDFIAVIFPAIIMMYLASKLRRRSSLIMDT